MLNGWLPDLNLSPIYINLEVDLGCNDPHYRDANEEVDDEHVPRQKEYPPHYGHQGEAR